MEGRLLIGTDLLVLCEEQTEPRTRAHSDFQREQHYLRLVGPK